MECIFIRDADAGETSCGEQSPSFPEYSPQGVKDSGNVSTKPFLRKAAMQMLKQGCGEGWLLQPKVLDMPDLEYR